MCKFNRRVIFLGYGSFPGQYPALRRYVSCIPFARSGFRVDLRCSQSSFSLFFSQPAAAAACIRFLLSGYGGVAGAALRVSFL